MRFLKSNTFKIIVACFVIFMAIPFIFVESSEVKKGNTPSIPLEQTPNPLVRFFDRIGSFYGFKKAPKNDKDRAMRPSFDKKGAPLNLASAKRAGNPLPAGRKSLDSKDTSNPLKAADAKTGIVPGAYNKKARLPEIKEYVRMDGETYEVIKDNEGRKFVAMPDGFVPYEKLMSDTVSQEEFQAAKAQAPQLEDWEIFEALRSPGGLPAYLASGGQNVYSSNGHGNTAARRTSNTAYGRRINGDNDDIYDERKLAAAIREKSRAFTEGSETHRTITSSIKSKYNDAKKDATAKTDTKDTPAGDLAELITTNVVLGNNQVKVEAKTTFSTGNNGGKLNTTIKPADEGVTGRMLAQMELGKSVEKDKNDVVFIYPDKFDTTPGVDFADANDDIISDDLRKKFGKSDKIYNNNKVQIEGIKQFIPGFRVAVVDGIEDGKVKSVEARTFHYKLIESFMGTNIPAAKYIDIKPEEKATTLLVVSDEDSLNNLRQSGYNAVLFEKFAITPADMEAFYNDGLATVQSMRDARLAAKRAEKQRSDFVKDMTSSRVGIRGI